MYKVMILCLIFDFDSELVSYLTDGSFGILGADLNCLFLFIFYLGTVNESLLLSYNF